jgi:hypothetical protein
MQIKFKEQKNTVKAYAHILDGTLYNYRKSLLKMTWYIPGLPNGTSRRRYHCIFLYCVVFYAFFVSII